MAGTICANGSQYLAEMAAVMKLMNPLALDDYVGLLHEAWRDGRKVFIFGNGGSASTASHHALDLLKTAALDDAPHLKVMSLADNMGVITAVGNDLSYDDVFRYPLAAYGEPGDVAVAITCSGNSPNILRACEWGVGHGLVIVGLTGFRGGKLKPMCDVNIHVPSENYGIIEDLHLSVGHIAAQGLRTRLQAERKAACAL